jgi:hypothetical protein
MKNQFNGKTEKRHPSPHITSHEVYEMVKDVHVVLDKRKRTDKNIEEDDMCKKQSIFWELPYWKDLDVCHSIDVMHIEKNVCESLIGTLLNTDRKTRDHGHARADLNKMGFGTELWLDDSVKVSVFSTPTNNRVYKITHFQFRGGFTNNEHKIIYPGSGSSLEVIALCLAG